MRGHQHPELRRSQQSISYYSDVAGREDPVLRARPDYFGQMYPHMLIQDVANTIMPIGGRTVSKPFRAFLTPPDASTEELIAAAVGRGGYSREFAGAVCDFFQDCAKIIMAFEEATYEIVYLSRMNDGAIVGFELTHIQPKTIMRYQGKLVQYVPGDVARQRGVAQHVELSPERVLRFTPPGYVQGKVGHIMESLAFLSSHIIPEFAFQEPGSGSRRVPYDSMTHTRARKLAVADAGKLIGWDARGLFTDEALEYYLLYRNLLFERFKIELRESILTTLNHGLDQAGREVGFSGRLGIEGLPTLNDVDAMLAHLAAGDRPFNEILEPFMRF